MRNLKFDRPTKINSTDITHEYLNVPGVQYYEHSCAVITRYGVVVVFSMKWENNKDIDDFTLFKTSINGYLYSASLDEGKLSEIQIKWLATHFMKWCLQDSQHNPQS